jgi:tRNA (guanosine-2'-O-)-methyltransferase
MGKQLDGTGLKRLHRTWRERTDGRIALILDGLGTPANVGSIVRSAAAWRVDHLWLAGPTPGLDGAGVGRTALGTERYLDSTVTATTAEAIDAAVAAGYQVVALELTDDAVAVHEARLANDVCLVIGHEDHGVGKAALASCSASVYLPQLGKVGSLNVATATAVAVYELRRRSWAAPA